jgi:hypothetical protein
VLRKNNKNSVPFEIFFQKSEGEIKTFTGKQKLKEFVACRCALQEMSKGVV